MDIGFALGFPLMIIIVFGSIAGTIQRKKKREGDDDLPPTGGGAA